eukprot:gene17128-8654_t
MSFIVRFLATRPVECLHLTICHTCCFVSRKAQEEQERRDYELAMRLSTEGNNDVKVKDPEVTVEDVQPAKPNKTVNKNSDLRAMKYDELRHIINTSTDIQVLAACRAEFHRRLKVYHDWRKKNAQNRTSNVSQQRAPVEVIRNAEEAALLPGKQQEPAPVAKVKDEPPQRFFRIPFAKPADQYRNSEYRKCGWWYAHFDGEWIARQLEIHPNGVLLFVAGKNDLEMCELSLTQCGLTRRSGAEITRSEFEAEWQRYGGTNAEVKAKPRK